MIFKLIWLASAEPDSRRCACVPHKVHTVYRVPQFMSPRWNWDYATTSLASECAPPPGTERWGAHSPVGEWGDQGAPIPTTREMLNILCGVPDAPHVEDDRSLEVRVGGADREAGRGAGGWGRVTRLSQSRQRLQFFQHFIFTSTNAVARIMHYFAPF